MAVEEKKSMKKVHTTASTIIKLDSFIRAKECLLFTLPSSEENIKSYKEGKKEMNSILTDNFQVLEEKSYH